MYVTSRSLLLVVLTAASLATTAGTAGAQNTAEGPRECDPCVQHLVGESHLVATATGVEVSACEDEYEAWVYEDSLELEWVGGPHGGPGCNVANCTTMSSHWGASNISELGGGLVHFFLAACLRSPFGQELECSVEATSDGSSLTASQLCAGGTRRWEIDASSEGEGVPYSHG